MFTEESNIKRTNALRNRKRPIEVKQKISKAKKGKKTGKTWNKGKSMTKETLVKLSNSLKEGYKNGRKLSPTVFKKGRRPWNVGYKVYFFEKDGIVYQTDNLTRFSQEYNLRSDCLGQIYKDNPSYYTHRGWKKATNTDTINCIKMYHL